MSFGAVVAGGVCLWRWRGRGGGRGGDEFLKKEELYPDPRLTETGGEGGALSLTLTLTRLDPERSDPSSNGSGVGLL